MHLNIARSAKDKYRLELVQIGTCPSRNGKKTKTKMFWRIDIPKQGVLNLVKCAMMVLEDDTKIGEGCTIHENGKSPNL